MRKKFPTAVAGGMVFVVLSFNAEAMPVSSPQAGDGAPVVTLIAGGCGIGWHRGPLGACRPNARAVVVAPAAPVVVAPGAAVVVSPQRPAVVAPACPRGFHLGPGGRACLPN